MSLIRGDMEWVGDLIGGSRQLGFQALLWSFTSISASRKGKYLPNGRNAVPQLDAIAQHCLV